VGFLLDTNIVSAHLNRRGGLTHRLLQHSGRLYISTVVVGELYAWAYLRPDPLGFIARIENELLPELILLEYDRASAETFGKVRATLIRQGLDASRLDLLIGCVALTHDLTLVTHNVKDFQNIPNLRIVDWLTP
jgi:tRNA(fMet)-specific endonuclease VapC